MDEVNKQRKADVENVILTKYLHIGDKVVMNMDPESRGWGRQGPDNGTKGVVVGFYRYKRDVSIIDYYISRIPGIYEGNGAAIILWEDGTHTNEGGCDIYWEDQSLNKIRGIDVAYQGAYETLVKVSDLPEVLYEIGDKVRVMRKSEGMYYLCTILRITYMDLEKKRDDGSPFPYIQYQNDEEGWHSSCTEDEIVELVERGNYWKWQHARESIAFKNLEEEAAFYGTLGYAEQCINPKTGDYGWTKDELLLAIVSGEIDVIRMSPGFFGAEERPLAFRYPTMPELGKRLREETMRGFADEIAILLKK